MARSYDKGFQSLGSFVPRITDAVFQKRSHVLVHLIQNWGVIAGSDYAKVSIPVKINFLKDEVTCGSLQVLVDRGVALEFQHLVEILMEKINQSLGFQAVARITLQQAYFESLSLPPPKPSLRLEKSAKPRLSLMTEIEKISDEGVKSALRQFLLTVADEA